MIKGLQHLSYRETLRKQGLFSLEKAPLSSTQWQDKQQWAQTETQQITFKYKKTFLLWGWLNAGTGSSKRLQSFHPWRYQNPTGHGPKHPAVGDPALSGGARRWSPEVPSKLNRSVTLFGDCFVERALKHSFKVS